MLSASLSSHPKRKSKSYAVVDIKAIGNKKQYKAYLTKLGSKYVKSTSNRETRLWMELKIRLHSNGCNHYKSTGFLYLLNTSK